METMWRTVGAFLVRNQDLITGLFVWPVITALMNIALRKKTPEEWEAWALAKPGLAFLIEAIRACGIDPFKLLQAFHRFAQRRAGAIPADAVRVANLPAPLKAALLNPETVKLLTEAAQALAARSSESDPSSPPADSAATASPPTGR